MDQSRRTFVGLAALTPLALLGGARAFAESAPALCVDPETQTLSQRNRRRSIGYADPATDAGKTCNGCAFFTPASGNCGTCQLLGGAPVSGGAVCSSFAPKPA